MSENESRELALRSQIDAIIASRENGEERPEAEKKLLRTFLFLISQIFTLTQAYKKGEPGRSVTSQEVSLKQKELWMLCPQISDMNAKNKIIEYMKGLHPELANIELEIR